MVAKRGGLSVKFRVSGVEEAVQVAWSGLICDRAKFVAEDIVRWLWPPVPADDIR